MNKTRLIIARHGNTFGPGDTLTRLGKTDLPLVASGIEQGQWIGRYLKQEALIPHFLYTSRLKRTIRTAAEAQIEMGTHLSPETLTIFDEIDYGPDENQPEEAVAARLGKGALEAWDTEAIVPDGWKVDPALLITNWKNFAATFVQNHPGKTALVITSNGIARFAPYLTGDFETFRIQHTIKIATGSVCLFENDGNSPHWTCTGWNIKPKDQL